MTFDICGFFKKSVKKVQVWLKFGKHNGYFTLKPKYTYYISLVRLRMSNVSDKSSRGKKTHILCSVIFFSRIVPFWDNWEKYCGAGQATDDNMVCAHWIPDNIRQDYSDTHNIKHLLLFRSTSGYMNASQCDVICTLSLLFYLYKNICQHLLSFNVQIKKDQL